jgi:hypothetical protein
VKLPYRDLRDNEHRQQRQEDRRSGQIAPIQRHRHRVAAGFAEGGRGDLDDTEGQGDFRDLAQHLIAYILHAVASYIPM